VVPLPGDSVAPSWEPDRATAATMQPAPTWKEPIVVAPPIAEAAPRGVNDATSIGPPIGDPTTGPMTGPSLESPYPTDSPPGGEIEQRVGDRYRDYRTADGRSAPTGGGDDQRSDLSPTGPAVRLDGTIEKHLPGASYDRP
jgi:hypothetical protein